MQLNGIVYGGMPVKSVSLQEAALVLGISEKEVQQKLQSGQLRGVPGSNRFGASEWRVRVNSEILNAISKNPSLITDESSIDFQTAEIVDVDEHDGWDRSLPWREAEAARLEMVVDRLLKPLLERIEVQAAELVERDRLIEEKDRQLRLLPDLEKRMEYEAGQAAARAQELDVLKSRIAELEHDVEVKTTKLQEMSEMETHVESLNKTIEKLNRPWWRKLFEM